MVLNSSGQTQRPERAGADPIDYLAVAVSWLVPGAGHVIVGERKRGFLFAVVIHLLFAAGLFVGGIKAINPPDQNIWAVTQFLTGWPMLVANSVQKNVAVPPTDYSPRVQDVGSVYCGIAGMLNLLVMFDVILRVNGGQRPQTTVAVPGGMKAEEKMGGGA